MRDNQMKFILITHKSKIHTAQLENLLRSISSLRKDQINVLSIFDFQERLFQIERQTSTILLCCEKVRHKLKGKKLVENCFVLNICGKAYIRAIYLSMRTKCQARIYVLQYIRDTSLIYWIVPNFESKSLRSASDSILRASLEAVLLSDRKNFQTLKKRFTISKRMSTYYLGVVFYKLIKFRFKHANHGLNWISTINSLSEPNTRIINRENLSLADPFIFCVNNRHFILLEKFNASQRGEIVYAEFTQDLVGEIKPLIAEKYHLSFPQILNLGGAFWLIPESAYTDATYGYEIQIDDKGLKISNKKILFEELVTDPYIYIDDSREELIVNGYFVEEGFKNPIAKYKIFSGVNSKELSYKSNSTDYVNTLKYNRNGGRILFGAKTYRVIQHKEKDIYGSGVSIHSFQYNSNSREIAEDIITNLSFKFPTHTLNNCNHFFCMDHQMKLDQSSLVLLYRFLEKTRTYLGILNK